MAKEARMTEEMSLEEHKQHHVELHKAFDELLADFISQTDALPSETTILHLLRWSLEQTENPTTPEVG